MQWGGSIKQQEMEKLTYKYLKIAMKCSTGATVLSYFQSISTIVYVPDPCMMPPRKAGRSLRSIFHTFLQRHMTCEHRRPLCHSYLHFNFAVDVLMKLTSVRNKPQSQARSKEKPHRRTTRPLSWMSSQMSVALTCSQLTLWLNETLSKVKLMPKELRFLQTVPGQSTVCQSSTDLTQDSSVLCSQISASSNSKISQQNTLLLLITDV